MSFVISSNVASDHMDERDEPCLCAQFAECWSAAFDAAMDAAPIAAITFAMANNLAEYADPTCPACGGSGVETVRVPTLPEVSLTNENAIAVFGALGLGLYAGECSPAEMRRAIMRARNITLSAFERSAQVEFGAPYQGVDGTVTLRPMRYCAAGLTAEGILDRIARIEALVQVHVDAGATIITWS